MNLPAKISFTNPDLWEHVHRARTSPPPNSAEAIERWIHLQHVPTYFDTFVEAEIEKVIEEHQGMTESTLLISGMKHLGKSDTITAVLLDRAMTKGRWQVRSRDGFNHVPFVFVEARSHPTAKAILKAACRFMGAPTNGDEDDLVARVSVLGPQMGVLALVIDEAQNFRRMTGSATTVTDGLRVLTHLPFPVIFTGIDLPNSALLKKFDVDGDSVEQVIERGNLLELWPAAGRRIADLTTVVRSLDERLSQVDGFTAPALQSNDIMRLVIRDVGGRPGALLERIKKAAAASIRSDRCLDAEKLLAKSSKTGRHIVAA